LYLLAAPVMMLQRLGMAEMPPYQMGLLMYGKRPSASEILRVL
jgi:hypothetical protein